VSRARKLDPAVSPPFVPPRFGTSLNPDRETRGPEVAERMRWLGKSPMPWQSHALDVALEVDPATGELWYEEVIITVPRQSGKSTLILALLIWRCVTMALALGAQTCTYIAQTGKMARRKLEREFARLLRAADKAKEIPRLSKQLPREPDEWKLSMNNGSEHIVFGTDSYLQIEAPNELGSHGDVLDVSVTDEAWAREDDAVEQATDAATVTRRSPQSWVVSTAGNKRSRFLARKVIAGRKCVDDPNSRTCYLEWSVPEDEPWDDPAVWVKYLPALGHTITVERLIARMERAKRNPDEVDEDGFEPGIAGFRRGYLNQWPEWPAFGSEAQVKPEISPQEWAALRQDGSQITGRIVFGVGVGHEGMSAAIVVAGYAADGRAQLETIEHEQGTWWLEKALRDKSTKHNPACVAWNNSGAARMLAPEIQRSATTASPPAETVPLSGVEWSASCQAFKSRAGERRIVHVGDTHLADAIAIGERQEVGDGWRWKVKDARGDTAALEAATAALRALETLPEPTTEDSWLFA
jgi:hypothetical protein